MSETPKPPSLWLKLAAHFSWASTVVALALWWLGPQFRSVYWLHRLVQIDNLAFLPALGLMCAMGIIIAVVLGSDRRLLGPALFGVALDVVLAGVILVLELADADSPD